jgi:VCBS repeat-containing protein
MPQQGDAIMSEYSHLRKYRTSKSYYLHLVFLFAVLSVLPATVQCASAVQVTLAWYPNTDSDLAGYKVYYGTSSGNYGFHYDAGNSTSYKVSNLQAGSTYYFAATAYDVYGNESDFSKEISYSVPNSSPVAQAGTLTTKQDTPAGGVLSATDPDGDSLTFSIASQGARGTAVVTNAATGAYTYTPNANATGTDSFTFQAKDPGGLTSTAKITVTITPVNHTPVAQTGTLTTKLNTAATGTLSATDSDGDSLTYSIVTQGAKGTAVVTNATTGAYSYTPKTNTTGTDSFIFRAKDLGGLSSTAAITVTIKPANNAPVAKAGTLTTKQGTLAGGTLSATDSDGDSLTYSIVTQGTKGTAVVTNATTGAYSYTPKTSATGTDSFTFQAKDPGGLASTARITVTIVANHFPVASNGTLTTIADTAASGKVTARDADGDVLRYQIVAAAKKGVVTLSSSSASFTYTPNSGITGTDTFTFKANDGKADSNVATVTVTIKPHVKIQIEAEKGSLTTPMAVGRDTTASGGKYISVPNGKGNLSDPAKIGGQALYSFNVTNPGNYLFWGRVTTSATVDNSFFVSVDYGSAIKWNTALGRSSAWVWSQITDNSTAVPFSCYLTAGTHTLLIKQSEDGTKLDQIVITTQPNWMSETVYTDATNGSIDGWDVFDADPAGSLISNVYDEQRESNVTELAGSGLDNGYRLRSKTFATWANSSQFVIAWNMKYAEDFAIYVEVKTSAGVKYLQYEPLDVDYLGSSTPVRFGVGSGAKNGEWHTIIRDLQADLKLAQPGVTILQVNSFSIRGSGRVDDIKLRQAL